MNTKFILFDKYFFNGLFAFVRKVELSIDRRQSYDDLEGYVKLNLKEIQDVINRLSLKIENHSSNDQFNIKNQSFIQKNRDRVFFKYKLRKEEVYYLITLLKRIERLNIDRLDSRSLSEVRLLLRNYYEEILGNRLDSKDKEKLLLVEHLNQNKYIKTFSIDELTDHWL
ncbi:MAG: hypothetical protein AB8F74_22775 [Saprospiraceae bacterium]